MKTFRRSLAMGLVALLILCLSVTGAFAASTETADGLTVTLTTDKEAYGADESVTAILTVTNANRVPLQSVTLKQLVPEGYILAEGQTDTKSVVDLAAGESVSLTVVWVSTPAEDEGFDLMKFYESNKTLVHIVGIVLGVILLAVLVALGIQKLRYSFLSMLLCACILFGAVSGTVVQAQALAPIEGSIKVSAAFTADGKEVTLEGTADYSMEPEETPEAVCTVTFETKGGSAVEPQQVDNGGLAVRPDVPTREGHVFVGWFADEACENAFDFTAPITKSCTVYAYWINTEDETDTDGDGLTDELEKFFGTDKEKVDTDGDGLSDYIEALEIGTDPLLKDTDGDGILDPDEDTDTDGLTDKAEIDLGTDILSMDTDGDGLLDGEEINTHKTDPLKEDTDEDGANDKWEIDNGFNALEFNESFETVSLAAASEVAVSVVLNLPGDQAETLTVTPVLDNPYLTNQIPGYIDVPFDFSVENEFEGTATISFEFDKNLLADETFVPTVYYFNEELMMLEELVTVIDPETGIASTEVEHFSTYILLNKTDFDTVWNSEIKPPDIENSQMTGLDIVFVIDSSGSMSWNDPSGIRKSAAKQFVDKMGEHDRAAIVDLDSSASLLIGFTNVKIDLNGKIDRINDSGGTSIGRAVNLAIQQFTNTSYTRTDAFKYIILLTDGQGDYNNQYTQNAADNDIVIYTIGLGSDVDENLLKNIADATKGKYFFATQADMLGEIFDFVAEETIDYQTDSNEDGISDYFTKILCDGKPYVNGALNPFYGLDFDAVQSNADYDGDGLFNGEEFTIDIVGDKVYARLFSYPTKQNSDNDPYNDYDEVNIYGSNPMKDNISFLQEHLDLVLDDNEFISNKYMLSYEKNEFKQFGVWIGNNIFKSNYDRTYLYKCILMDYLKRMVQAEESQVVQTHEYNLVMEILKILKGQIDAYIKFNENDINDALKDASQRIETAMKNMAASPTGDMKKYLEYGHDAYFDAKKYEADLSDKLQLNKKVGKAVQAVGVVLDIVDILTTGYDFVVAYAEFEAHLSEMTKCLNILYSIYNDVNTPLDLRIACQELIRVIENQEIDATTRFFDAMGAVGGKVIKVGCSTLIAAIPYVGPVYVTIETALGIADFVFNIGDVAEQCTYLYAIAKSASILSDNISHELSVFGSTGKYVNVYGDLDYYAYNYYGLAEMRQLSEEQMDKTNKANMFIIRWFIEKYMYDTTKINENIRLTKHIKDYYRVFES